MPARRAARLLFPLLLAVSFEAHAQRVPDKELSLWEMVSQARSRLRSARSELVSGELPLNEEELKTVRARLGEAERALDHYVEVLSKSTEPEKDKASLMAAGGVVVADDATGIGAADDVLLPVIGLALAVVCMKESTASRELSEAQLSLILASQSLLLEMQMALAKKNDGKCSCKCARLNDGVYPQKGRMTPYQCKDLCLKKGFTVGICK
jgi:hypothetical protein